MAKTPKFRPEPYSQGPHAHAVHDAGGKLISVPMNRAKFDAMLRAYAPGCGSDIRIPGSNNGFARCGSTLGDGKTQVFCPHCEPGIHEALRPHLQRRLEVIDRRLEAIRAEMERLDSTGQSVYELYIEIGVLEAERKRILDTDVSPERASMLFAAMRKHVNGDSTAESIVDHLLETGDLVRVCAACEDEFGPLDVEPGKRKTHGVCARHVETLYPGIFTPEEIAGMNLAPDMAQE